jgi:hypothetical protein
MKRLLPTRALLAAESLAQKPLARADFGPSLMFLLEKPSAR